MFKCNLKKRRQKQNTRTHEPFMSYFGLSGTRLYHFDIIAVVEYFRVTEFHFLFGQSEPHPAFPTMLQEDATDQFGSKNTDTNCISCVQLTMSSWLLHIAELLGSGFYEFLSFFSFFLFCCCCFPQLYLQCGAMRLLILVSLNWGSQWPGAGTESVACYSRSSLWGCERKDKETPAQTLSFQMMICHLFSFSLNTYPLQRGLSLIGQLLQHRTNLKVMGSSPRPERLRSLKQNMPSTIHKRRQGNV